MLHLVGHGAYCHHCKVWCKVGVRCYAHTDTQEVQVGMDHTIEPAPGTIREDDGEYIGDDAAECAYCGEPISGDENGWYHLSD